MKIEVLKSKIHRVRIVQTELDYVGSITIDENLMEAANIISGEKVHVLNLNNGERFTTYVITGQRDSGMICLNGPAARKACVNDEIIVVSFALMDVAEAKNFKPTIIFPDAETNKI